MAGAPQKLIAATLITLMGTHSVAWIPQALADPQPRVSTPVLTFSFQVPDRGMIDQYHSVYSSKDNISYSLYLLRNLAVEDLLNTRRSLMLLIGEEDRLHRIAGTSSIGYEVPGTVNRLYRLGEQGSARFRGESGTESGMEDGNPATDYSDQASRRIDPSAETPLIRSLQHFDKPELKYDEDLRLRVLAGLVHASAQLTAYDQQLKFLQEDFWLDPKISEEYMRQEVEPQLQMQAQAAVMMAPGAGAGLVGVSSATFDTLKDRWLTRHGMKDIISAQLGGKEYLLNRYHLLAVDIDGVPLYKLIYQGMQAQGFPDANMVQPPNDAHLPQGQAPIQLATQFENQINEKLTHFSDFSRKPGFLADLYKAVNTKIDLALVESLKANSQQLASITAERDYDCGSLLVECSSNLLELGKYEDLWDAASDKYAYLSGLVDMTSAHQSIKEYWEKRDKRKTYLRYTAIGVGIGIGVAGMVLTGGAGGVAAGVTAEGGETAAAALTLLNIPLRSWLIGAGLVADTGLNAGIWVDSERTAQIAKGLYLGTVHHGNVSDMKNAVEMSESDFLTLKFCLANLVIHAALMTKLSIDVAIKIRNGSKIIQLSEDNVAEIKNALAEIRQRSAYAAFAEAALSTIEQLLGLEVKAYKIESLTEAVTSLATKIKAPPSLIWSKIGKVPGLGTVIEGLRMRDVSSRLLITKAMFRQLVEKAGIAVADPFGQGFVASGQLFKVGEDAEKVASGVKGIKTGTDVVAPDTLTSSFVKNGINEFAVDLVAEYAARGKKMLHEEKGAFIEDMIRGTILSAIIVYNGTEVASEVRTALGKSPKVRIQGEGPWSRSWNKLSSSQAGRVVQAGAFNTAIGMIIKGSVDGTHQIYDYIDERDNPDREPNKEQLFKLAKGTLWSGLTMGISTTLRYEYWTKFMSKYASARLAESGNRFLLIEGAIRTPNNLFGNWSYIKAGQFLGVMDEAGKYVPADEPVSGKVDVSKIVVSDVVGGYFKVSGDETSASYMFDFLRGGTQAAGPEPVIQ